MKTYDDLMLVFAPRLRKAIKRSGKSVQQIARNITCDATAVYYYQQGKRLPNSHNLCLLADELGVSLDWLFGRKKEAEK